MAEKRNADDQRVRKHSITIAGHRTSLSLEEAFWHALSNEAEARHLSMNALVEEIDRTRTGNLSSAIRVHLFMAALAEK